MASCIFSLCFCVMWVAVMLGLGVCCDDTASLSGAYAPGDIIIGILGSVHSKVKDLQDRVRPDKYTCTDFDLIPFVQSLAVIHTIEEINDSGFLPGIQLGYLMCDPCVYGTKALQCVEHMLAFNKTLAVFADNSNFSSPVKAFLGERYSELSIPVAKLLSLYMIPQISCTSSSPALSDKLRYASFFRVIPSDVYQTKALAKLMSYFNWDWVGVVSIDDDYGKPALENFLLDSKKEHICVDFQELLPNYLGFINIEQRITEVANRIRSSTAKVVLLILRPELVEMLFQELIKTNTTRIWIASDAWSMARLVMKMKHINKLVDILRKMNFTLDDETYSFNQVGDFENGYDLIMWKKSGDERIPDSVGRFLIKNDKVEVDDHKIPWTNSTVPKSRCSEPCPPGTEKNISSISCCYTCTNCREGYYSNATDQLACKQCPEGSWSLPGSRECQKWKVWFLEWSAAYSIVVMIGTVIGALLLVFSFIFYILHREKPIIKDILVTSCLMKFGLMAVHIFLELMSSNPTKQRQLRKFDKPYVIIGILTVIQALICIFWMIFDPVNVEEKQSKTQLLTLNRLCTQGAMYGFGVMHVYIALLAVLSFGLAFKGRDDETDPIVFSMLIHLFAWLCFIPVFITQYESRPIVQISAIMVSNYGVIFCHFAPKWFKILPEKAETLKTVKPRVDSLTTDSGISSNITSGSRESIPSIPQSRFSFAESEPSNWDINSLHLSEASIASFSHQRSRSLRSRSLRSRSWRSRRRRTTSWSQTLKSL
ncbi:hypothetical protein AOLI_G00035880 [Acnodon oligacanthus]